MPMNKGYNKMSYGSSSKKKTMGHDGGVTKISTNGQKYDMGRVQKLPSNSQGYPQQAFNYKW